VPLRALALLQKDEEAIGAKKISPYIAKYFTPPTALQNLKETLIT